MTIKQTNIIGQIFSPPIIVALAFGMSILMGLNELFPLPYPPTSVLGEDTTPPAAAQISINLPAQTTEHRVNIKGQAEVGSLLKIIVNDRVAKEVRISDTAQFDVWAPLSTRTNYLQTKVVDIHGNASDPSGLQKIVVAQ